VSQLAFLFLHQLFIMDLLVTHPVKKSDLGFHGNLFGGKLLSWFICNFSIYLYLWYVIEKNGKKLMDLYQKIT
jgi:hypothetical protein